MILTLVRTFQDSRYTQGRLTLGDTTLHTLENPWIASPDHRGGLNGDSCVPAGEYRLVPHNGGRWKNTWALVNPDLDVYHLPGQTGRFAIVFHRGTHVNNTDGCPLIGTDSAPGRLLFGEKAEHIMRRVLVSGEHSLSIRYRTSRPLA